MTKEDVKETAQKIRERYKMMRSLAVKELDHGIELLGMEYLGKAENFPTDAQVNFLLSLGNTFGYKNTLLKGNRWFISACIDIARDYPNMEFDITIS